MGRFIGQGEASRCVRLTISERSTKLSFKIIVEFFGVTPTSNPPKRT
jgi:hypothetical protein